MGKRRYIDKEYIMNEVMKKDFETIIDSSECDYRFLEGKTIFVTGATGLIGNNLINFIAMLNKKVSSHVNIVVLVRDFEKANKLFKNIPNIDCVLGDVEKTINYDRPIDYIIHAASNTSSKSFINTPVEVINTAIIGTKNVLELARQKHVSSMVYLSTMEVYGAPDNEKK